jgi:D-cysteine desulfhydrase
MVIPFGGSSPLGVIGFVNAAFELKEQILKGAIPEPDYLYVATGSMGTAAGLILGLRAANSKTKVVSVRVTGDEIVNARKMVNLIHQTNRFLSLLDPSFPMFEFLEDEIDIRHTFFGKRYALFTREGMEAVSFTKKYADINLEGTYTGKAFAALMDDARKCNLKNKVLLFWNTYNSRELSRVTDGIDYHSLPHSFHSYFEKEVQLLERESR